MLLICGAEDPPVNLLLAVIVIDASLTVFASPLNKTCPDPEIVSPFSAPLPDPSVTIFLTLTVPPEFVLVESYNPLIVSVGFEGAGAVPPVTAIVNKLLNFILEVKLFVPNLITSKIPVIVYVFGLLPVAIFPAMFEYSIIQSLGAENVKTSSIATLF